MPRKPNLLILLGALLCVHPVFSLTEASAQPPNLQSPALGSPISTETVTFGWSTGTGVTEYYLGVGTTQKSISTSPYGNIYSANTGALTSATVNAIPLSGNDIYVRLWYKISGAWQFKDYSYPTQFDESQRPVLLTPASGSTISTWPVDFSWSAGKNVTEYWLGVGTSQQAVSQSPYGDIHAASAGMKQSVSVAGVPLLGQPIYVRLWYKIGGNWFTTDHVFDTITANYTLPEMQTPVLGSVISSATVTFIWTPDPSGFITEYWLGVGTSRTAVKNWPYGDIFRGTAGLNNSLQVSDIPLDGRNVHVKLWYKLFGKWYSIDRAYMTTEVDDGTPKIITPARNSTLADSSAVFSWTTNPQVQQFFLGVSTNYDDLAAAPWGSLFAQNLGTATSQQITGIPLGDLLYVRLWYKTFNLWFFKDYIYATRRDAVAMISPAVGTTVTQSDVTFEWSEGSDVEEYMIGVGTTQALVENAPFGDIFPAASAGVNLTQAVTGIPDSINEIFVRLSHRVGANWTHTLYRYDVAFPGNPVCGNAVVEPPEECDDGNNLDGDGCSAACIDERPPINVDIIDPVPGSTISSYDVDFTWTPGPAGSVYSLSIGTCDDQPACVANIYTQTGITATTVRATNILLSGNPVYVTLLVDVNTQSVERKYMYNTTDSPRVPGEIYSPPPGATITSSTVRFEWEPLAEPVDRHVFFIGTCTAGSCLSDVFGADVGRNTAVTVTNFPLDGEKKYATIAFVFPSKPTEFRTFEYDTSMVDGCGNGQVDPGEQCDGNIVESCLVGGYDGTRSCLATCQFSGCATGDYCGDGDVTGPEECDDMNTIDDDSCSNACKINGVNSGRFNDYDAADNTLIIYNANAAGGQAIAEYYAAARSIPLAQICSVRLPVGVYATKDQLLGARKAIVENCICNLIPAGERPSPCNTTNLDNVAAKSPVSHIVLIKGMPARLFNTGWTTDAEEPSFDYYLSYLLYRNEDVFGATNGRVYPQLYQGASADTADFQPASAISGMPRSLVPGFDKFVAYGRVEALTEARTFELIDRTIAAERDGLQGNMFIANNFTSINLPGYEPFKFMAELTDSLNDACLVKQEWDESCRAGFSYNGHIPGELNGAGADITNIPNPVNAAFYVGPDPFADNTNGGNSNAHRAFDGFNNMLNWHVNTASCVELCKDFPTQPERDNCRAMSIDYFKEINTECVGGAPGFLAHQVRSWTVQNYGFAPAGWGLVGGGNGAIERTPPQFKDTGGYTDARFADTKYVSFGSDLAGANPLCDLVAGQQPCEEFVAVNLRQTIDLVPDAVVSGSYTFTYKIRYRNFASPSGELKVQLYVKASNREGYADTEIIPMTLGHSGWTLAQGTLTVDNTFNDIQSVLLDISSTLARPIRGWVDIDGIELIDDQTLAALIDADTGSFNSPQLNVVQGDWAANVIDRMGGIGSWGSSSHHLTGGWAFANSHRIVLPMMASGRTLGEALAMVPDHYSGIIYADPLYRPSAAKIYLAADRFANLNSSSGGGKAFTDTDSVMDLNIVAWHGTANTATTQWFLSVCPNHNVKTCNDTALWTDFASGVGARHGDAVNADLLDFVGNPAQPANLTVRLKVFNPGEDAQAIYNYAYFNYQPPGLPAAAAAVAPRIIPAISGFKPLINREDVPMHEPALDNPGYTVE